MYDANFNFPNDTKTGVNFSKDVNQFDQNDYSNMQYDLQYQQQQYNNNYAQQMQQPYSSYIPQSQQHQSTQYVSHGNQPCGEGLFCCKFRFVFERMLKSISSF